MGMAKEAAVGIKGNGLTQAGIATRRFRKVPNKVPAHMMGAPDALGYKKSFPQMPRRIRTQPMNRTARAPAPSALMEQPTSPKSPVAVNGATGREAVGPWAGPFQSTVEHSSDRLIYLDREGSGHYELDDGMLLDASATGAAPGSGVGPGTALAALQQTGAAKKSAERRLHLQEVTGMHRKPLAQFAGKAAGRGARGADCRLHRTVFQPRQGF